MSAVFVQTNEAQNAVVAFRRDPNGGLTRIGSYETGGAGDGEPQLTSQGSVILTGEGRHLLVTNAASDDVTLSQFRATRRWIWWRGPRRGRHRKALPSTTGLSTCSEPGSRRSPGSA